MDLLAHICKKTAPPPKLIDNTFSPPPKVKDSWQLYFRFYSTLQQVINVEILTHILTEKKWRLHQNELFTTTFRPTTIVYLV